MSPRPSPPLQRRLLAVLLTVAASALGSWLLLETRTWRGDEPLEYVGSAACSRCHPAEAALWRGSDHDRAMQRPAADTVAGDFAGAVFAEGGARTRFLRRGETYLVETAGPDGAVRDYPVAWTFGHRPLQQLLLPLPGGRLQALDVAWDVQAHRWYALHAGEDIPPGDPLHWTGRLLNWNAMCAECHSTGLVRGYDPEADRFATSFQEEDVACEACHGPGSRHLAWAGAWRRTAPGPGLTVRFNAGDPEAEVQACAPCHSRRRPLGDGHVPGTPFLDDYQPELLRADLYHPDGQILDEVYVWGSFVQSRMYARGVRCSDCHEPHTARLRNTGNALCTRCHAQDLYDASRHHHHDPQRGGTACVDCHMPGRFYMGVDFRRDHGFRVPRPDLAAELGTPDACTACHLDQDPAWAAAAVTRWYGPVRRRGPDFARALAAARGGADNAARQLAVLAGDRKLPPIVRATALAELAVLPYAPGDPEREAAGAAVARACRDAEALVRAAAASVLELLPPPERARAGAPLLADPRRAVRVEAARALAGLRDLLPVTARRRLDTGVEEFLAASLAMAEQPGPWIAVGAVQEARGRLREAEAAWRQALRRDPDFVPALMNLAVLHDRQDRLEEAEAELRRVLRVAPQMGEAWYGLGLLLGRRPERLEEAAAALQRAARLLPRRARVHYNLGVALLRLGRREEAAAALERAAAQAPGDPDVAAAREALARPLGAAGTGAAEDDGR